MNKGEMMRSYNRMNVEVDVSVVGFSDLGKALEPLKKPL